MPSAQQPTWPIKASGLREGIGEVCNPLAYKTLHPRHRQTSFSACSLGAVMWESGDWGEESVRQNLFTSLCFVIMKEKQHPLLLHFHIVTPHVSFLLCVERWLMPCMVLWKKYLFELTWASTQRVRRKGYRVKWQRWNNKFCCSRLRKIKSHCAKVMLF